MQRAQTSTPFLTQKKRSSLTFLAFCLPALVVYVVFWVLPGLSNVLISMTDWSATTPIEASHFVGLSNWVQEIVTGGIIVFAVALDRLRHRRS